MFFVLILLFFCCDGFLIDSTNPPGTGQFMTDKHYKMLMDLFIGERHARVHLENFVTQLQKELLQTQTALGNKLHELNMENNTLEQYVKELRNKTEVLGNRLIDVENENIKLNMELNSLRKKHGAMENQTHYFDTEINSLKQLKSVANLQAVFRISNLTDHLEHELQNTNSQIVALQSSDNARTQDFLALYNKTMVVEQTMNSQLQSSEKINKARIQKVAVDVSQNSIKVAKALDDISAYKQRTAVSLYPVDKTYPSGSTIMFTNIITSNGLNSTRLADIQNKGYFTSDQDGLYWISVSIVTHTASAQVHLYKNGNVLEYMKLQHETSDELTTFTLLERLSIGDTIIAKAGTDVRIHSSGSSVLSLFQFTI